MPSKSIARSLQYNEEKVTLGKAECILADNFLKDISRLTPEDKLHCFERRMELNERVVTSQHITLNFDPLDKLSNEQMQQIARSYMNEIGFGRQPYLVYRHHDAGHPHCHIVTTHVRPDGNPIKQYNIGRNQSEKARLQIEAKFNLVTKEMKARLRQDEQKINGISKITYGERSVARSMSQVLEHVMENYKYTSLDEFNTVLRLYNLEAYRGREHSQLYQHRGLLYRVLDEQGKYIGVPLKASFFDCKPTLNNLEKKFELHQSQKHQFQQSPAAEITEGLYQQRLTIGMTDQQAQPQLTTEISNQQVRQTPIAEFTNQRAPEQLAIEIQRQLELQDPNDLKKFIDALRRKDIHMVLQQDKEGINKEISYVDSLNKCILKGNDQSLQQSQQQSLQARILAHKPKHKHRRGLHL